MRISQDVIRRDMLKVKDGENTLALPLMKELDFSDVLNEISITAEKDMESIVEDML